NRSWRTLMTASLKAEDLWPLVQRLSRDERVRLAKLALGAASRDPSGDSDDEALAWEAEGWEELDAPRGNPSERVCLRPSRPRRLRFRSGVGSRRSHGDAKPIVSDSDLAARLTLARCQSGHRAHRTGQDAEFERGGRAAAAVVQLNRHRDARQSIRVAD